MNYPVQIAGIIGLVVILSGLVFRGRWRIGFLFTAYIVAVGLSDFLGTTRPETFFRVWFYIGKQGVIDALKMGFVLEFAFRTFRVFPGARRSAYLVVSAVLGLGSTSLLLAPLRFDPHVSLGSFEPRVGQAVLWTIVAVLVLARYYNISIHPFHRNVLLVMGLYQTLFGGMMSFFADTPFLVLLDFFNKVAPVSYLLAEGWWAYLVWQPETAPMREHEELVRRVEQRAWAS